jgi:5'-nucleotidase
MSRPRICVTNDDGIESPGLRAAVEAVLELGRVVVLAPRHQQSSMGRSLHGDRNQALEPTPYEAGGRTIPAYACNVSPALALMHGLNVLGPSERPDLVIAGVNFGENLGLNVTLSGTIGAALEAACAGIPALAVSLQTDLEYHYAYGPAEWRAAQHFCRLFAAWLLGHARPPDLDVLNVNIPRTASPHTPWRLTRLSRQSYFSARMESPQPEVPICEAKVGVYLDHAALTPDSDIYAIVRDGVVSVTPLSADLTSRTDAARLAGYFAGLAAAGERDRG